MAEVSERVFRELVLKTMDAAIDEDCWPELLRSLAAASGGIGALVVGCAVERPNRGFVITGGLDSGIGERFLERYQDNPWSRAAMRCAPAGAFEFRPLVEHKLVQATEFYREVLKPQDTENMVGLALPQSPGIDTGGISIAFDGRNDAATRAAVQLLNLMAPYLRRAMIVNVQLRAQSARDQGLEAALHRMPCAVLLLAQDSRVLFANRRAEQLLSAGDGLCVLDGELHAARASDSRALRRRVGETGQALQGRMLHGPDALAIARPSGRVPLSVLVAPVHGKRSKLLLHDDAAAMLIVTDPEEPATAPSRAADRLQALFGLTPTEASVAVLVALGMSGPEAAGQLGIGPGTVHAHLKSVFAKTGVRRQSGLARLLTRSGVLDIA